jgi:RHS repeat-associated protein
VTYGSGDFDTFGYDPNTARMTSYTNTVGGVQVQSNAPLWNANGTLGELQTSGTSTILPCSYTYDDLSRLQQSTCGGTIWTTTATTYSYDPFGNIFKSGSTSFQPTYNTASNQFQTLPTVQPGTTLYDANGNLTFDGMYTYSWDAEGKMVQLNNGGSAPTWTSDALGRWVETNAPQNTFFGFGVTGFSQAVYDPTGVELALATGSALASVDVHVPLAAGAWAQYTGASLSSYWHPDWLGTSHMETTPSGYVNGVASLGPFGEIPNTDISSNIQGTFTGSAFLEKGFDLWDFPAREQNWNQARWITPDPVGINAVDPTNPQSWNRYAYALNNPLINIDPRGLYTVDSDGNVLGSFDGEILCDDSGACVTWSASAGVWSPNAPTDSSSASAFPDGSLLGMLSWASSQAANVLPAAVGAVKNGVVCPALNATLGAVANAEQSTVGFGYGGGAGVGLFLGASGAGGVQVVADQHGNYGLAISAQGSFAGVWALGANEGYQATLSNAGTIYDYSGGGYDLSVAAGDGIALGVDVNISPEGTTSVTTTLGAGAGFKYSTSYNASHTWVPKALSIGCGG